MPATGKIRYRKGDEMHEETPAAWGRNVLRQLARRRKQAQKLTDIQAELHTLLDARGQVTGILRAGCRGEPTPRKHMLAAYLDRFSDYAGESLRNTHGMPLYDKDLELAIEGMLLQ